MEKDEMKAVVDALARINRSLNERFEKDANLYIPAERIEKIKHLVYLGNYQQIAKECLELKMYSPEAMANVLIKNAWLMKNSRYNILQPIFVNCNYHYLQRVMSDGVFDNKLEMPTGFRLMLITIFLENADAYLCQQMLTQNLPFLNRPELRAVCVVSAIKELPPMECYIKFKEYTKEAPSILTQSRLLKKAFSKDFFTPEVKSAIFENDLGNIHNLASFWTECLGVDDAAFMFQRFVNHCRQNPTDLDSANKVLPYLFELARKNTEHNMPLLAQYFAEACAAMDGNNKSNLASRGLSRVKSEEEPIFERELSAKGISGEKNELKDLNGIIELMNERRLTQGLCGFLVKSFKKNYDSTYEQSLNEIAEEVDANDFALFCCYMVRLTDRNPRQNMKYLLYVVENVIQGDCNYDNDKVDVVNLMLKHIENNNIFQKCSNIPGIDKVKSFVRENDFDLFSHLTAF